MCIFLFCLSHCPSTDSLPSACRDTACCVLNEHREYIPNFAIAKSSIPCSLHPTPCSLLPAPYSLLPTPYSLLLTPYSLLLTPYSLLLSAFLFYCQFSFFLCQETNIKVACIIYFISKFRQFISI